MVISNIFPNLNIELFETMPIEILMPALSPTMVDGTLAKWLKKEGEKVKAGQVIAEIETDKATMEVEAVDEGTLGKILVKDGTDNVAVNRVIALLLKDGEDKKTLDSYVVKEATVQKPQEVAKEVSKAPASAPTIQAPQAPVAPKAPQNHITATKTVDYSSERVKASPLAKRVAEEFGVDLHLVEGSGPKGRVVSDDVTRALKHSQGSNTTALKRNAEEFYTVKNSNMRKTVAKRLSESKQLVPHFYLSAELEIDKLLEAREQINKKAEEKLPKDAKPAYKISVNDLVIKAASLALKDNPLCNSSWYDDAIVYYNNIDISVAVAIDGGLITPIIKNADQKTLIQISNEMKELATRARKNELKPEEYQGGGFSISNLGMYGVKTFSAIINPPQSCILAVGAGETRPAFDKKGNVVAKNFLTATLSVDHRSVDGALGAEFLKSLKSYIEEPLRMFV